MLWFGVWQVISTLMGFIRLGRRSESDKGLEILYLCRHWHASCPFRRLHRPPDKAWLTQQARQVMWELRDREPGIRFLIRDNDKKFSQSFDTIFRTEDIVVIPTPYHAPNANAFGERWIRSAREECLDKLLIINQAHLRRVMREYMSFFNTAHPHRGLEQTIPVSKITHENTGPVRRRAALGGIIHDYYRDAA